MIETGNKNIAKLEVQIAVYGQNGMAKLLQCSHPATKGVLWRVAWQLNDADFKNAEIPESLSARDDFSIEIYNDKGIAINRNHLLNADLYSEIILFGDDDTNYTSEALNALITAFKQHPDADIICCRYTNRGNYQKPYSNKIFDLRNPPRGWYISMIEMAVRTAAIKNFRFADCIGSSKLFCGEETILLYDMLKAGKKGLFVPFDICRHDDLSTGERMQNSPDYAFNYGAVLTHIKPFTWPLRLLLYSYRSPISFMRCLNRTMSGAIYALKNQPFKNRFVFKPL